MVGATDLCQTIFQYIFTDKKAPYSLTVQKQILEVHLGGIPQSMPKLLSIKYLLISKKWSLRLSRSTN